MSAVHACARRQGCQGSARRADRRGGTWRPKGFQIRGRFAAVCPSSSIRPIRDTLSRARSPVRRRDARSSSGGCPCSGFACSRSRVGAGCWCRSARCPARDPSSTCSRRAACFIWPTPRSRVCSRRRAQRPVRARRRRLVSARGASRLRGPDAGLRLRASHLHAGPAPVRGPRLRDRACARGHRARLSRERPEPSPARRTRASRPTGSHRPRSVMDSRACSSLVERAPTLRTSSYPRLFFCSPRAVSGRERTRIGVAVGVVEETSMYRS